MQTITRLGAAIALTSLTVFPAHAEETGAQSDSRNSTSIPGIDAPPMSAHDLVTAPRLGAPIVTKDGVLAVYSVTLTDPETLDRSATHYLQNLSASEAHPVELDLRLDAYSLAFGPDNALYFLSSDHPDEDEELYSRVWRATLDEDGKSSNPTPVADMNGAPIFGFKLAPTGDKIALWAEIPRSCPDFGCEDEPFEPERGSGRLYDSEESFVRHWDTWTEPGTFNRVFVFDIEDGKAVGGGTPVDGVDPEAGITGNTPTMPFGGDEDFAWAPDGSALYFVARESNKDEPTSTDLDIYVSDLSGSAPVVLTADNEATDTHPVPSPDGKTLAYVAMERPGYESDRLVIHLRDLGTDETRALTANVDLSFGEMVWSKDGRYLFATAAEVLDTPVYQIDVKSGEAKRLDLVPGNEAHIGSLTALPGNGLLFARDSINGPRELFLSTGLKRARRLTDVALSKMDAFAPTVTTRFSFAGAEGDTVWGQITRLKDQEGPIPAILYIHGGPQGSFNDVWSSRWNARAVASQGYAVISVDFHGSAGYGQDFMDSINRDWGGKPLIDLQKGLEAALAKDSQIDSSRACAMGASYGGYMVNWIAGNWPDRFNCLVQHDGLFDMRSFYYSTEELWFPRWDFGGSYSEARDTYEKWNPVNHVDKWQTPMLVITGEKDFRVPYLQGLQSFTALKERGVPSQLLVFPDENHWVLGAANSLQWHETVFAWLDRWLKKADEAEGGE